MFIFYSAHAQKKEIRNVFRVLATEKNALYIHFNPGSRSMWVGFKPRIMKQLLIKINKLLLAISSVYI